MKFQDFLTLKEDEGGVGGEAAPATTGTEGQGIETQAAAPTEGEGDPEDDDKTGESEIDKHVQQPGNLSVNFAGWTPPIGLISRLQMPQIPKEMYGEFLNDLKLNKIKHRKCKFKACDLVPTQGELNTDKVEKIKASMQDGSYKGDPILVAGDQLHIADGHHRWAAYGEMDEVPSHYIDLSFEDLYKFLDNKPYVLKRSIRQ